MRTLLALILTVTAGTAGAAATDWVPNEDDRAQHKAREDINIILEQRPELADWFEDAAGYAVFRVLRVGAMWGGAIGSGVVTDSHGPVGHCRQFGLGLGPQLGAQAYRQVILFRDNETLDAFRRGHLEFQGRASIAALTLGASAEPAHLPEVALFSLTRFGVMLEASANGTGLWCRPKPDVTETPAD